ncbi:class I SAM-dependent methyltransferase [Myxococcus sp. K38C18041901]|uniref:class I SAM-dependent methyltransferase n=1 Tax=Myxococcus guangdongensis TaxID=2906760 RepID=UPI0020A6DC4C|nr:methyltransferase domain-containing protein [Myxococcus guangdongensis]MCP3063359.1 class I SAM-dependent methyltransferase [Myxococcus guangdongensis]
MTAAVKRFDDAGQYEREIRQLLPGYDVLHAMPAAVLGAVLAEDSRVLVVGCGPAHEAVALARALPGSLLDALDPSSAMVAAARETVRAARMTERIRVVQADLGGFVLEEHYDAAVVMLVGHMIPDDGAREEFLHQLARALRPGGVAILAELEDTGAAHGVLVDAHMRCALEAGLPRERAETLRGRLMGGFHLLTRERLDVLLAGAGLKVKAELFRAFGMVGRVLEREA